MPCNCGRKKASSQPEPSPLLVQEPMEWGPFLWSYLHSLAERMGTSGSRIIDTDQAGYMEILLGHLPHILPCMDCQAHAVEYQTQHPVPSLKGLYGEVLRQMVREWLFSFHQDVRQRKEQPLEVTLEECAALYHNRILAKRDYDRFVQNATAAVKQGWIRLDQWRKWYSHSEKIRILSGLMLL